MLRDKDTRILSEIKNFFTSSEKAMESIFDFVSSLTFSDKKFGLSQASNKKYGNSSKLVLLLLFPIFKIHSSWDYGSSALYKYLSCGKDVFYRLLNNAYIDWRDLGYSLNMQLIRKVRQKSERPDNNPRCLIIDDTDLPKTGRHIELIGKIYSHVTHAQKLGFKGLFMAYHDGTSLFSLDLSLHGEKGKNQKRQYGLTDAQRKKRYSKKRGKSQKSEVRVNEYFSTKIQSSINMIRTAIKKGIRFDYVLVDSWFTCFDLVKFIVSRRIGCHLIGMIKMGKTKYTAFGKELTAKEIADAGRRKKKVKRSKRTGYYYFETIVNFKGAQVKLFLCRSSKKGTWNGILSTNTELSFEETYKIYSTRWSIEVFFKEAKQHLGLGKCQSQDFDAQIATTTICMIQYNLLSTIKRFGDYETFGELFRESQKNTLKLTIAEQIWLIITEIANAISEMFEIDTEMLMEKICADFENITKLLNIKNLLRNT